MAHEIRVPRLGWSMEEGTFIAWLKSDGEEVKVGEPLFELEGEKSLQQIESLDAGILRIPPNAPGSGETVAVGALLGYLATADEAEPWKRPQPAASSIDAFAENAAIDSSTATAGHSAGLAQALENAEQRFDDRSTQRGRILSTPRARRIASELGIEWKSLQGTGSGGRIREADVRRAATESGTVAAASATASMRAIEPSSRRRVIADRMRTSQRHNAPVTLTMRADASALVGLRNRFKSSGSEPVPAYTDIVAGIVARVLRSHRPMAARWDAQREKLLLPGDTGFAIGIAVHTDDGLVVPVLRDADLLTLREIAVRTGDLIDRARHGRLSAAEMQGGVFTVTSLGSYGVETFTPIISDPETAILGLGAIRRDAVVVDDDRIAARDVMTLSLTFDHCRVDGVPAARFLEDVRRALESSSEFPA